MLPKKDIKFSALSDSFALIFFFVYPFPFKIMINDLLIYILNLLDEYIRLLCGWLVFLWGRLLSLTGEDVIINGK